MGTKPKFDVLALKGGARTFARGCGIIAVRCALFVVSGLALVFWFDGSLQPLREEPIRLVAGMSLAALAWTIAGAFTLELAALFSTTFTLLVMWRRACAKEHALQDLLKRVSIAHYVGTDFDPPTAQLANIAATAQTRGFVLIGHDGRVKLTEAGLTYMVKAYDACV